MSLQSARRAIEYLRKHLREDIAAANLVLNGSGSVLVHSDGELVDLVRQGQGVLNIVPLGGVVGELDTAIHELHPATPAGGPAKAADGRR